MLWQKKIRWKIGIHATILQRDDRQTDGRQHIANVDVSSRSLKMVPY